MTQFKKEPPRLGVYKNGICVEQCLAVAIERLEFLLEHDSKKVSSAAGNVKLAILRAWDLVPEEKE